jgi:regulator of sigma E protease
MLAVLNLLPIPALDGGHVMFLLYEMVSGRKPSEKFLERALLVGFFILIGLVLFANGNDIFKAIFK